MLNRLLAVLAVATVLLGSSVSAAAAGDGGVTCPPNQPICIIVVHDPGGPGGGGQPGASTPGQPVCKVAGTGEAVPCYDPTWGWWSNADGCYYQRLAPQPPATAPEWAGHYPNGAIYAATCIGAGGTGGGWTWFNTPPQGYGGAAPTPAQLAQQAVDTMRLDGPAIGMAPPVGKTGLVGLPVWLWTTVRASTWGPTSASASVPGLTVTATARAKRIVWDMGDGHSVTCASPGTPYSVDKGARSSPNCGYVYTRSSASQPGHAYKVTATTTWDVAWSGGGQSGVITVTRSSTAAVRIGEMQVLVS